MYRFIVWFNCIKTRFKSKRFIIPIIFALTFLFFPKDAFAIEVQNVRFYNNNQLVHTFSKNDIDGQYSSIDPQLVDYFEINFTDVVQTTNTKYEFTGNFDMAGDRVFDTISSYLVFNNAVQNSAVSRWFLYSTEIVLPFYSANYQISSNWTSTVNSNFLSMQFDLGADLILSSFRLNQAKLLSNGEAVGDVISNQTQQLLDNQNKNQQQTNERLDELIGEFKSCKVSDNLFTTWQQGNIDINGNLFNDNTRLRTSNFIDIDNKSEYFLTLLDSNYKFVNIAMYNGSTFIGMYNRYDTNFNNPYTYNAKFPDNINRIRVIIGKRDNSNISVGDISIINPTLQKGKDGVHCSNKIDETNEKLDELNDSINDDNVSGATNTGNDFFDNFNSKDNGGISRIVTMPLTLINGLISGGTCSNLEFEVLGKEVYFPSGCILWQNAPSSIVTIYRTIICGLFSYILAIHLFKDIEDLKNPNKEEVSTLDL